jgi:hypothetical protein
MSEELYCFFDSEKNLSFCVAEKDKHYSCKYFQPVYNGRPCLHFRKDIETGGCDNSGAQWEAYVAAKK